MSCCFLGLAAVLAVLLKKKNRSKSSEEIYQPNEEPTEDILKIGISYFIFSLLQNLLYIFSLRLNLTLIYQIFIAKIVSFA